MNISVLVPIYNAERYLAESLASITEQTLKPDEILVLNDGSTDGGPALARGIGGVRVLDFEHRGKSAAMNDGISAASCEWIAMLDADDLWAVDKLQQQVDSLQVNPELRAIYCMVEEFVSPDLEPEAAARLRPAPEPVAGHTSSAALIHRSVFAETGGFDVALAVGEFIEWYSRSRDAGVPEDMIPSVLVRRRLHANNLSRSPAGQAKNLLPAIRQMILRRRAEAQEKS